MNDKEYEFYKPVRNLIRKYAKSTLLELTVRKSYLVSKIYEKGQQSQYLRGGGTSPHYWLLLGKWVIKDWDNIKGNKSITQDELIKIINEIISFEDQTLKYSIPGSSNLTSKLIRREAFRQVWYQSRSKDEDVGRDY